jgi:O-succinylbenzoic acid--CoA ligase
VLDGDLVATQDRGRWVDGRLQVLGRLDDVVISGGENVDLAAAQLACDREFGELAVVLLAVPDERWGTRIVAVTTGTLRLGEVRRRLEPVLGRAATPKELRQVGRLAYTSIGKIDRTALLRSWAGKDEHGNAG